ncbi:DUF551 domain-containing protein [Escherichia coli]|nr:DUF551 domain-containing protein [Escherichia coli]
MSEINYQALREAAERAIPAMERLLMLPVDDDLLSEQELKDYGVDIDALNAFKLLAGPETVLALLDERERNQQYIKRRDQENEMMVDAMHAAIALTSVGIDLDDYDECVLRLHEWGALPDYCIALYVDFVHGIVSKNKLLDFGYINGAPVWTLRDELEAANKRIAELEAEPVSQAYNLAELIEGMEVSIDVSTCDADLGNRYFGTVTEALELDTAKNGYILLVQDAEPNFDVNGNSPVTPGGWISCSDRMPEDTKMLLAFSQGEIVAAYWNWVVNPIDYKKYRTFTYLSGNILDDVTHWMPLPEPPL